MLKLLLSDVSDSESFWFTFDMIHTSHWVLTEGQLRKGPCCAKDCADRQDFCSKELIISCTHTCNEQNSSPLSHRHLRTPKMALSHRRHFSAGCFGGMFTSWAREIGTPGPNKPFSLKPFAAWSVDKPCCKSHGGNIADAFHFPRITQHFSYIVLQNSALCKKGHIWVKRVKL